MSLKETIEQWCEGVDKSLDGHFQEALTIWSSMQEPGARILYNMASMHMLLGDLDKAKTYLDLAVAKDPHLALAYFQKGYVALQQKRYADAVDDMNTSMKNLRNNTHIDYKQLGLQFKLYSCEVMYNHACALFSLGKEAEAMEKLETAKGRVTGSVELQQRISDALNSVKEGKTFELHKLPDSAMVFQPPRNKTEVLKPVHFLGKAKVVSSVKDQDSYVGFVGVQEGKLHPRSPSPNHLSSTKPAAKPQGVAPLLQMKIRRRETSLNLNSSLNETNKGMAKLSSRPLKPSQAPPLLHPTAGGSKLPSVVKRSPEAPIKVSKMTVKVHYSTTKAMRVSVSISFKELLPLICKKFHMGDDCLTLWCKNKHGELKEIADEQSLRELCRHLDDGFRMTMWAYDKHEEEDIPVLMTCVATHTYKGQFEDELSFNIGDELDVTADINDDWYEGRCNGVVGIFPKSHIKIQA